MKKVFKKTKKIIWGFLVLLLAVLFVLTAINIYNTYVNPDETSFILGYKPIINKSENMYPLIKKNDIVVIKKYSNQELKENNIIYYKANEYDKTLEKISRISDEGVRTVNEINSEESLLPVKEDMIIGVGLFVVSTSYIIENKIIAALAVFTIIMVYVLVKNIYSLVLIKQRKKKE